MKFDPDTGDALVALLEEKYPNLPKGKLWIKYGKQRIYFNEKVDDIDYGFYVEFEPNSIEIGDFMEEYWLDKIGVDSEKELAHGIEDLYFEVAYPLEERYPFTTIREIRQTRRFEAVLEKKEKTKYIINPLSNDMSVELAKEDIEAMETTDRTHGGKPIYRITIKRDALERVADYMEEKEDEADRLFMEKMQQSIGGTIKVGSNQVKAEQIVIEEGEERTCINCHRKFIYNSTNDYREFCSPDCVKEYQQER